MAMNPGVLDDDDVNLPVVNNDPLAVLYANHCSSEDDRSCGYSSGDDSGDDCSDEDSEAV